MSIFSPLMRAFANARPVPLEPVVELDEARVDNQDVVDDTEPRLLTDVASKRKLQSVSTKAQRVKVLKWMQETVNQKGTDLNIISETVRHFPDIFRAERYAANIMKCSRWWKSRATLLQDFEKDHLTLSHTYLGSRKRVELKARPGRGRKTADWNTWLYPLVRNEFERLRKTGLKFSPGVLQMVAKNVLQSSPHPTYGPSTTLVHHHKPLIEMITPRWVQQFQETQGIVHRTQTGKLQLSPSKMQFIERSVAFHMGELKRGFASGELNEDLLENMDETHFVVNMDNKKTLGFRGDKEVKYADVVSGGMGITMVVKVTGGVAGKIAIPFLIFQNAKCSYPIRGIPDTVPGVAYRTSSKSFMTSGLMTEYYKERRVNWIDPSGRKKIQWIDNSPGHNLVPACVEALERIKTDIKTFPANSTHLTQPCDSFVISKIKDAWRRRWDAKKMDMIQNEMWQGDGREGTSGALKNPGWKYFLQLAADSVREVNAVKDKKYGISFARKAMIRCGLSLNTEGIWSETQLTAELQEIIAKYPRNYEGFRDGLPGLEDGSIVPPASIPTNPTGMESGSSALEKDPRADERHEHHLDTNSVFQDAQPQESVDVDAVDLLQTGAELWGFLDSQYNGAM